MKIDYSTEVTTISGKAITLEEFRGDALLIVNTASQCGFTKQYVGLEALYQRYRTHGFSVLGFPCDQFGNQEPGSDKQISEFCSQTYGISFPMFSKIEVNGPRAHSLYQQLKSAEPGLLGTQKIKWNFSKFLISTEGEVLARYDSSKVPEDLSEDIEDALGLSSRS